MRTLRNVRLQIASEAERGAAYRLKRLLRDTPFRPAYADGEPVEVADLERAYLVRD